MNRESIWKLQEARPHSAPRDKSKNTAPSDFADWCLLSSHQVPGQSDNNRELWTDFKISNTPGRILKNPAPSDWADWCLVSSWQVLDQLDENRRLWNEKFESLRAEKGHSCPL